MSWVSKWLGEVVTGLVGPLIVGAGLSLGMTIDFVGPLGIEASLGAKTGFGPSP